MDMSLISSLLPEFLGLFKGNDSGGLQDIAASLGNSELLTKSLGGTARFAKYLPLIPLLSKLNTDGFRGLLNNSDDVSKILSVLGSQSGGGESVDLSGLIQFLPAIASLFKKEKPPEQKALPAAALEEPVKYVNPFHYISEIADKEILSALARYISKNTA